MVVVVAVVAAVVVVVVVIVVVVAVVAAVVVVVAVAVVVCSSNRRLISSSSFLPQAQQHPLVLRGIQVRTTKADPVRAFESFDRFVHWFRLSIQRCLGLVLLLFHVTSYHVNTVGIGGSDSLMSERSCRCSNGRQFLWPGEAREGSCQSCPELSEAHGPQKSDVLYFSSRPGTCPPSAWRVAFRQHSLARNTSL